MDTFCAMFNIICLFLLLLIPGFILGKAKLIQDGALVSFSNILMYVAMPFLVFVKILQIDLAEVVWTDIVISILCPIFITFLTIFLGKLLCRKSGDEQSACIFCATFSNCGFLGIPLAATMWQDMPQIVLYVSIYNVVSTFLMLTVGTYLLSGDKKNINIKKTLISPIFFAVILGIIGAAIHLSSRFSGVVLYAETLANLATPLSLLVLGFELSKMTPFWKIWTNKGAYVVSVIKLIVVPLIVGLCCFLLKDVAHMEIGDSLLFAMMTATAVSTAASAPAMAQKYDKDAEYVAELTLSNTLFCLITLPIMYMVFSLI